MNALIQSLIVSLLLGWSLLVLLRRFFPAVVQAGQHRLAAIVARQGGKRLALWLRKESETGGGCDSGCHTCRSGCSTPQPVQWHSPSSSGSSR